MISVARGACPAILTKNAGIWADELCRKRKDWHKQQQAYLNGKGPKPDEKPRAVQNRYAYDEVKQALHAMFGTKCAYCEAEVEATGYSHVEHFRPQSIYPILAYDWGNLLQACTRCNGNGATNKGDRFPVLPHGRTLTENPKYPHLRTDTDLPILIDPCREDPTNSLTFRNARVVALNHRGKRTRDIYNLNREALLDYRRKKYQDITFYCKQFCRFHQAGNKLETKRYRLRLREMVADEAEFAGMARAIVTQYGINWTVL